MKIWMIIIFFLFGAGLILLGGMARLSHTAIAELSGTTWIKLGFGIEILAVLLLIVKTIVNRKTNSFLIS